MKRMSEEFKLPLKWLNDGTVGGVVDAVEDMQFQAQEQAGYSGASRNEKRQSMARAAAHAINHVDALADALEEITADYLLWCGDNPDLTTDQHKMMVNARKALKAYRGGK